MIWAEKVCPFLLGVFAKLALIRYLSNKVMVSQGNYMMKWVFWLGCSGLRRVSQQSIFQSLLTLLSMVIAYGQCWSVFVLVIGFVLWQKYPVKKSTFHHVIIVYFGQFYTDYSVYIYIYIYIVCINTRRKCKQNIGVHWFMSCSIIIIIIICIYMYYYLHKLI